jgi:hypothetical protein
MGAASSGTGRRKAAAVEAPRARANDRNRHMIAIPIDSVADAAIAARNANLAAAPRCDVCEEPVADTDDDFAGRGLYVWSRGDETRYEEPALCPRCATVLGISALNQWRREEEEDE